MPTGYPPLGVVCIDAMPGVGSATSPLASQGGQLRRSWPIATTVVGVLAVMALPAQAGNPQVDVFLSGGDLNIHAQSGTPASIQVSYIPATDEWEVIGNFVTEGSGCPDDSVSGIVKCPEGGEDVDVEFADLGGSISFNVADSFLNFDTDILLGDGSENVDGTDGVDVIHAGSLSTTNGDDIDGLDGADQITTGNSSDIIDAGDGSDTVVANGGNNFINGGEAAGDDFGDGDDNITAGPLQDTIDGGMGGDTIDAGDDDDVIDGSIGNDIIDAGPGDDGTVGLGLHGGDGEDQIDGGPGDDEIQGDDDNDTLDGGGDEDTLDGELGNDTLNGEEGADTLLNSDGKDVFSGGTSGGDADEVDYSASSGASPITADIDGATEDDGRNCPGAGCEDDSIANDVENLTGDSGADLLVGGTGANTLDGAGGSDTLAGGAGTGADGADRFNDPSGTDTVTYNPSIGTARTAALTIDIDGNADDGSGGEQDDVEANIENVTGGSGGDQITGSTSNNQLRGGPGTANDTLSGNSGDDTMFGGLGTNTGPDGADTFLGGAQGAVGDAVSYAGRNDPIVANIGGGANDGAGGCPAGVGCEDDNIGADLDRLIGGSDDDTLTGDADDNSLDGASGDDTLAGGTGTVDDGADALVGGIGTEDEVSYASRTGDLDVDLDGTADDGAGVCPGVTCELDNVATTVENVIGGSGDDDLTGNSSSNELTGNDGDDDLVGGTGVGPDGADVLSGGDNGTAGGQNSNFGDSANYLTRDDDLDIDLGGGANDGAGGCPAGVGCEHDDVKGTVENLRAGDGDDVLIGNDEDNILIAGQGNDLLQGGAGTKKDGADNMSGGNLGETTGDTISYANRTDDIVAGGELGGVSGGGGCPFGPECERDTINQDTENLTGGSGDDTLSGTSANNTLRGSAGDDILAGSLQTDTDGADTFIGGLQGTKGDTVTYDRRDDDIDADIGGGADDEDGDNISSDIDNLTGGDGDDDLFGDVDPNVLDGGGGDDALAGGQGVGPDGTDRFIGGTDGTPGGQHFEFEDLVTYFTRADDITANLTTERGGAAGEQDRIDVTVERINGGNGDDTLTGDLEANRLEGAAGDDMLAGGMATGPDGADIFVGGAQGPAGDTVTYESRDDDVGADLGGGADDVDGDNISSDIDNLTGGDGDDSLTGDGDPNTITGGAGGDILSSLANADRIEARDGFPDLIDCGTEADAAVIDEGTVDSQAGCETLDQPPLQPPATKITDGPKQPTTTKTRARFVFIASEPATFTCQLDSGPVEPCTSPKRYNGLALGPHTFTVIATDLIGQPDPTPATYDWEIVP